MPPVPFCTMVDAQKNTWKHWNSLDIYTIRRLYTKIISNHVYIAHQSSKRHSSSETFSSEHKQIVHFLPMPLVQSAMLFSPKRIVPTGAADMSAVSGSNFRCWASHSHWHLDMFPWCFGIWWILCLFFLCVFRPQLLRNYWLTPFHCLKLRSSVRSL